MRHQYQSIPSKPHRYCRGIGKEKLLRSVIDAAMCIEYWALQRRPRTLAARSGDCNAPAGRFGSTGRGALVGADVGALGDVPVGSTLVEAARTVRTLYVVGGIHGRRRRQVLDAATRRQMRLGLLGGADVADELLVLFAPVLLGRSLLL